MSTANFLGLLWVDFGLFILFLILIGTRKKVCYLLSLPLFYFATGFIPVLFHYYPVIVVIEIIIVILGVIFIISSNSSPRKNITAESSKEPIKAIASDLKPHEDPIALKNLQVHVLRYGIDSLYLRMMNSDQYQRKYSVADRPHAIIHDLNLALEEFGYSLKLGIAG